MRKTILFGLAIGLSMLTGFGIARADFGWLQYSTPCVPTGVAATNGEIAAICPDDCHVYIKTR